MTLGEKQELFARLLPRLLDKAHELGFDIRIGDCFRDARLHGAHGESYAAARYERGKWYSTTFAGVQHRGAHVFVQDVNFTGVFGQAWDVFCTMDVSFAGMK